MINLWGREELISTIYTVERISFFTVRDWVGGEDTILGMTGTAIALCSWAHVDQVRLIKTAGAPSSHTSGAERVSCRTRGTALIERLLSVGRPLRVPCRPEHTICPGNSVCLGRCRLGFWKPCWFAKQRSCQQLSWLNLGSWTRATWHRRKDPAVTMPTADWGGYRLHAWKDLLLCLYLLVHKLNKNVVINLFLSLHHKFML